jgi:tetratricopeptide (TPR) repeat protein
MVPHIRRDAGQSAERTRHRVVPQLAASLIVALLGDWTGETRGRVQQHAGHALGTVDFPISCSEHARVDFNRAIALLHHMTYPQARQAFERVATSDPRCAMAHWGIAMTLFQPLWPTRPRPDALQRGWEAVQKAKALQPATERERLFVAAAEAFFLEPSSSDYWLRIRRWEQAMEKIHASFPDDPEAAAFFALAHLANAPATTLSRAHSDRAAEVLVRVYTRNPDHPGAMHYLVHANDAPGRERELLEITHKYETVAPRNPHALHMPTHIYTRLGDWNGVIRGNLRAAEAALEHPAGDHGEFVWDEFPHAIEYLVYAYLQKGADDEAAAQLKRLRATARLEPTFKTAFHLASTQARYALERRAWNEAALLIAREPATLDWDGFTWPEAIARFARGLGAAHLGNVNEAKAAGARLEELEAAIRKAGEDLFASNIRVLRLELNAWIAHVEGQGQTSVALMREAAEVEASTPKHAVTPGPTLPADELLGDLLMEQKQPAEALTAYRRSMERYPKRFNTVLGAARAARARGNERLARTFYEELLELAEGGMRQPALKEAQAYVAPRADQGHDRE